MAISSDVMKKLDSMEKALGEIASRPVSKASAIMGGFGPGEGDINQWPVERLKKLGQIYNNDVAANILTKGASRGIGWGPALVKMAGLDNRKLGVVSADYSQDAFEKEYGFTSVSKAASTGVKGLNSEVRKVALAEGSGITGGYLVPPNFLTELMTIAAEDAFFESKAKVVPMTTRTLTVPMLDITTAQSTGTSPYFGGITAAWQPEASTIGETEPTFRQSEWTAWDLVLYTVSSNQLLADNGIGLDALLTQLFSQAMTWYTEYAFLRGLGAGSSMPMGIINAPASYVQSRSSANTFKLADAAAMMSRLHVRSWDSACWIMHQSVMPQLIQMYAASSSSDALVWMTPFGDGKQGPAAMKLPKAFLNGLPIYFTEKVPTLGTKGDVMLVDLSHYLIGKRMETQIDVSPHLLFRTNQLAWRVVLRLDGRPWLNSYITDANGWVSSPFVVLNT